MLYIIISYWLTIISKRKIKNVDADYNSLLICELRRPLSALFWNSISLTHLTFNCMSFRRSSSRERISRISCCSRRTSFEPALTSPESVVMLASHLRQSRQQGESLLHNHHSLRHTAVVGWPWTDRSWCPFSQWEDWTFLFNSNAVGKI